jgi:hypothetical protein
MPEPPARPAGQPPPRPPGAPRTPQTFGPEPWRTAPDGTVWSHWDRWFCLVAVLDYHGDLDDLESVLVDKLHAPGLLASRRDLEAKLSHLADLRSRLDDAGASAADVAADDTRVRARARKKVLDQALEVRALTPPMRATPRARLRERALRGWWPRFPMSPAGFYEKFRRNVEVAGFVSSGALYRAYQTALYELTERADDSSGALGQERTAALLTYLDLDWRAGGLDAEIYWRDLCDFLVLDDYALLYRVETAVFGHVGDADVDLVEAVLLDLAEEYRACHLDTTSGEALQLLAWLHVAGGRLDRYVDTAGRLGSQHWAPIVALAESATAARHQSLAAEVFAAADRPGPQQDYLRRRCHELTGVDLSGNPHLRAVPRSGHAVERNASSSRRLGSGTPRPR